MLKQPSTGRQAKKLKCEEDSRQEICKLAYTGIADEYVESSKLFDGLRNELLSRLWFPDISRHSDDLAASIASLSD